MCIRKRCGIWDESQGEQLRLVWRAFIYASNYNKVPSWTKVGLVTDKLFKRLHNKMVELDIMDLMARGSASIADSM